MRTRAGTIAVHVCTLSLLHAPFTEIEVRRLLRASHQVTSDSEAVELRMTPVVAAASAAYANVSLFSVKLLSA